MSQETPIDKIADLLKPKAEKKLLKWNFAKNKVFVCAVQNTNAYKRTNQLSESKWQLVHKALYESDVFKDDKNFLQKMSSDTLRVKYHKMCNDLKKSVAIAEEGANLSKLPGEVDEVSKLLLDMMEEVAATETAKKAEGEKKQAKQVKLSNINKEVISSMGEAPNGGAGKLMRLFYKY